MSNIANNANITTSNNNSIVPTTPTPGNHSTTDEPFFFDINTLEEQLASGNTWVYCEGVQPVHIGKF